MSWPWEVHLDRKVCRTGVYSNPNTTWTLGFDDTTINCVVLSNDFGEPGKILTPTRPTAGTAVVAGDYSAGCVMLGRLYAMSLELTRPYRRMFDGTADLDAWTTIKKVIAAFRNSGPFTLRASMTGFSDRTKTFSQDDGEISDSIVRTLEEWFVGPADHMRLFIESTSPKPVIIPSVDIKVDHEARRG